MNLLLEIYIRQWNAIFKLPFKLVIVARACRKLTRELLIRGSHQKDSLIDVSLSYGGL